MHEPDTEREQEEAAAAEAGAIGGSVSEDPTADAGIDPAERPLREAGEGEAEGFELAEEELEEHASHGDEHAARRVIQDADGFDEDVRANDGGEADEPTSDERDG